MTQHAPSPSINVKLPGDPLVHALFAGNASRTLCGKSVPNDNPRTSVSATCPGCIKARTEKIEPSRKLLNFDKLDPAIAKQWAEDRKKRR